MPRSFRFKRWWIIACLFGVIGLIWLGWRAASPEPTYQGERLSTLLRRQPNEYEPAVRALGTNALPYLLREIQARDSAVKRWGERQMQRWLDRGTFWRTDSDRQYHANLALQILDTNAVPALLDLAFAKPIEWEDGNPSYAALAALRFMDSAPVRELIDLRVAQEIRSPDGSHRENAYSVLAFWPEATEAATRSLAETSRDTNAAVRLDAVNVMATTLRQENIFVEELSARLNDDHAVIRTMAAHGLAYRTTNAVAALPALHAAYAAELGRSNSPSILSVKVGLREMSDTGFTPEIVRIFIKVAIEQIDPLAKFPETP